MKIAQIGPVIERIPPKKYGGTERVVHALTEQLVKRGHEVTLFGSGDSITSAKLVSVYPRALRESRLRDLYGMNAWTMFNIGLAYDRQAEFDIIHDHSGHISLPTANAARTPVVMTMHGAFTPENRHIYRGLNKPGLVTISKSQAIVPGLNYLGTVYNGLDVSGYPFSNENDGYLLFVGRISMEKGVHNAIEVAVNTGLPLIIAAKLDDTDRNYFRIYVEPYLSEKITWIGEVDETERNRLMSRALCSLHPITWREPFGLTVIEAMACGCPVVAFGRGSIPELVVSGKTGFVVETIEEMIDSVVAIDTIDRHECRRHALENFNAERMTEGYEKIYAEIIAASSALPDPINVAAHRQMD
ncbi:MAG: glycosyltransferase family 4 protein [Patescibacteria group bacterium]|nr:glycosyltransferase family 4 protein [Patescibacteria group bacterium]MDE2172580.1 glycosyltransferase family 4 protein [Patescibacteria group bacterium]